MEWESGRQAAESSNEVVFECSDGSFCCSLAVDARWDELVVNTDVGHVVFYDGGAFVVKALELRSETSFGQDCHQYLVCFEDGEGCPGWHGFSVYDVGIVIVENKYVVVAEAGRADEAAGLVSVDLTGVGCDDSSKAVVGPVVVCVTSRESEGSIWVINYGWCLEDRLG